LTTSKATANRRAGQRLRHLLRRERELWDAGRRRVCGVDEAGMGPLAGPVVAAAVIFPPGLGLRGVNDSKRLTPQTRARLAVEIREKALSWSVARVDCIEIDTLNIYHAGLEAMRRAIDGLPARPDYVLVDGRRLPNLDLPQERMVKGDLNCHAIAAASILAKTDRDALMAAYDEQYPGYDFSSHKGYPTEAHRNAIRRLGPSPIHRLSFALLPQPKLFE
jgi:ribonuclease HII